MGLAVLGIIRDNFEVAFQKIRQQQEGLVVVRLTGGLGNQLFGWALGRSIVQSNNDAHLVFDLSDFSRINPRKFELDPLGLAVVNKVPNHVNLRKIEEAGLDFDPSILDSKPSIYLKGYFQSWKYFQKNASELRDVLLDLRSTQDAWYARVGPFNAIQVRRGDYLLGHNFQIHGVLSKDYFLTGARLLEKRSPNQNFIIFSDDLIFAKMLSGEINSASVDEVNDSPLQTLLRMSFASNFLISNSSFGWWAAWVGSMNSRSTIVPSVWLKSTEKDLSDFYLEGWEVLESRFE
jgi:hypothetical protein